MRHSPESIRTREQLAKFISDLAGEARSRPTAWENLDLPAFLEALAAVTQDMDGYFANRGEAVPEPPTWSTLGEMLIAATIYE